MTEFEKDCPIEVYPANNGFVAKYIADVGAYPRIREMMVFQSFTALSEWLESHFTYRSENVKSDKCL